MSSMVKSRTITVVILHLKSNMTSIWLSNKKNADSLCDIHTNNTANLPFSQKNTNISITQCSAFKEQIVEHVQISKCSRIIS